MAYLKELDYSDAKLHDMRFKLAEKSQLQISRFDTYYKDVDAHLMIQLSTWAAYLVLFPQ